MNLPESVPNPQRARLLNWTTILSVMTAVIAVGTVTLHLIGVVRHRNYLGYWGIYADLFPKATHWVLVNGYYGIMDRSFAIFNAFLEHWLLLGGAFLLLGAYVFLLMSLPTQPAGELPGWMQRWPLWGRRLFGTLVLALVFYVLAPLAMFLLTAVMAVISSLGEMAGTAAAERHAAEFLKGCKDSSRSCVELKRDGVVIATGFLLDSSSSHVAIFDAKSQQARIIALEHLELVFLKSRISGATATR